VKKISYEKWCSLKDEERGKEKERQKKIEEMSTVEKSAVDESSRAFRRYVEF
jgi:hypothetical protein